MAKEREDTETRWRTGENRIEGQRTEAGHMREVGEEVEDPKRKVELDGGGIHL